VISGVWHGDHKSCTRNADTSCGSAARGYPTPDRYNEKILVGVNPPVNLGPKSVESYLVYSINKSLSVISTEISNFFDLITVREDVCDQTNTLMYEKSTAGQLFPGWRVWEICDRSKDIIAGCDESV